LKVRRQLPTLPKRFKLIHIHATLENHGARERTQAKMATTPSVNRLKRKLPDRIAQVRGDRSQRQFARDLGVFQQNVNRYENGTTPHTDFLLTMATKENVSLDWLLLGKGRMRRSR